MKTLDQVQYGMKELKACIYPYTIGSRYVNSVKYQSLLLATHWCMSVCHTALCQYCFHHNQLLPHKFFFWTDYLHYMSDCKTTMNPNHSNCLQHLLAIEETVREVCSNLYIHYSRKCPEMFWQYVILTFSTVECVDMFQISRRELSSLSQGV